MSEHLRQDDLLLVLELTADDTQSCLLLHEVFPYAKGDQLVLVSYSLSLALIRLAHAELTMKQRDLLCTTSALVGFCLKERAEALALLASGSERISAR